MWHMDYKNIDATFRRRVLRTSRLCAPNTVYDIEVRLRRTTDAQMPDRAVLGAGDGPGVARRDGPARAGARRTTAAPRRWWTGGRIPDLMVLHNSTFHNRKPAHSSYVVSKSVRLHDVHIYLTFIHNHMVTFMRFIILAVRFSLAAVDWP